MQELRRPRPPFTEREPLRIRFEPDNELARWVRRTFIYEDAPLHNSEHAHLELADLGFMWTDATLERRGRSIVGVAEMPNPRGHPLTKARALAQLQEWDVEGCDFIVTLSAPYCAQADDASFCALIEHELYHCAQALDEFGLPRFRQSDGQPIFTLRGHDVEEFVGVVDRYGAGAAGSNVEQMVRAAEGRPAVTPADLSRACGTCLRQAA